MIVVTNRIPVAEGHQIDFEDRFKKRVHLVDQAPGFVRNEVHRPRPMKFDHSQGGFVTDASVAAKKKSQPRVDPGPARSSRDRTPQGEAMKYLTFIRHPESQRDTTPPPALMEAMGTFIERATKDGSLVDTGGLLPSKEGVRVRLSNGEITVTDGPFSESKEVIGGWAILQADTKAEVIAIATEFMELHRKHWPGFEGESEVRPMFDPGMGP